MTKTAPAPDDGFTTMGPDAQEYSRYALVTILEDQVILYDIDEEEAWIQSDTAVRLADID